MEEATFITLRHVRECVQELEIPHFKEPESSPTAPPSPQQINQSDTEPQTFPRQAEEMVNNSFSDTLSSINPEPKTPDNIQHSISGEMLPGTAARDATTDEGTEPSSVATDATFTKDTTHNVEEKEQTAPPPHTHDNDQQSTQAILEDLAQFAQKKDGGSQSNINIPINALPMEDQDFCNTHHSLSHR